MTAQHSVGPVRTCVGCRGRAAKNDLLRIVAVDEARALILVPDPPARRPGRGAYLHPDATCLATALRRRAFARALRLDAVQAGRVDADLVRRHVQQ